MASRMVDLPLPVAPVMAKMSWPLSWPDMKSMQNSPLSEFRLQISILCISMAVLFFVAAAGFGEDVFQQLLLFFVHAVRVSVIGAGKAP